MRYSYNLEAVTRCWSVIWKTGKKRQQNFYRISSDIWIHSGNQIIDKLWN